MKLEQRATIPAPRGVVWRVLMDIPRAARCLPGVKEVTALGGDRYRGTMEVRVGPMGVSLSGDLAVTADPTTYRWRLEGQGRDIRVGGGVRAIIEATLTEPRPGTSELTVQTDLQFAGALGTLGQPLIRARADAQMREFAANLAREVAKEAERLS